MKSQRGFSFVEMMITVVLGLLVTGAVISLFVGVRSASRATSGAASSTDGGRFALNFLETSVRSSGNMGCASTLSQGSQIALTASPMSTDYIEAVGGYEAVGTNPGQAYTLTAAPVAPDPSRNDWVTTVPLSGALDPLLAGLVIKGTDVLVVRSTLPNTTPTYLTAPAPVGTITLNISDATNFQAGAGILTNCISSMALGLGNPSAVAGPATISVNSPISNPGNLTLAFETGAQLAMVGTTVYYIGQGADGDGSLFSATVNPNGTLGPPQELVPDIENMQILYGIDTNGNHVVAQYVTADQVNLSYLSQINGAVVAFNGVVSVRIALLAASPPNAVPVPAAAPTYNLLGTTITAPMDSRMRRMFDVTVELRNTGI